VRGDLAEAQRDEKKKNPLALTRGEDFRREGGGWEPAPAVQSSHNVGKGGIGKEEHLKCVSGEKKNGKEKFPSKSSQGECQPGPVKVPWLEGGSKKTSKEKKTQKVVFSARQKEGPQEKSSGATRRAHRNKKRRRGKITLNRARQARGGSKKKFY